MSSRIRITAALVGLVALVLVGWLVNEQVSSDPPPPPAVASDQTVPLSALPAEAATTWRLIQQGGPFRYPRDDGAVFQNREKLLPVKESGYYHEYTVHTPRADGRGARRLVTGSGRELYYTDDHYLSFVLVDPGR